MHISGVVIYCKEDHSKSFIRVCLVLHNAKARQRYPKIEIDRTFYKCLIHTLGVHLAT